MMEHWAAPLVIGVVAVIFTAITCGYLEKRE